MTELRTVSLECGGELVTWEIPAQCVFCGKDDPWPDHHDCTPPPPISYEQAVANAYAHFRSIDTLTD